MLGHLKPKSCGVNPAYQAQYKEMYCSICASLRRQYHVGYSFLLNHELTLAMLALRAYLPAAVAVKTACPARFYLTSKPAQKHPVIDLAGRFSVILGWIKATDWATDNPRFYKNWVQKALQTKAKKALPALPTRTQAVLSTYLRLTQENSTDFDLVRQTSGELAQVLWDDLASLSALPAEFAAPLSKIFALNGELIAVSDHLIDLEKDWARKEYNPILWDFETQKIPLAEGYLRLIGIFNRLKLAIYAELACLHEAEDLRAFRVMLQQAIRHIEEQIARNRPVWLGEKDEHFSPVFVKADCGAVDCGGCDSCGCDCDCSDCGSCDCSSCALPDCGTRRRVSRKNVPQEESVS